MDYSKQIICCLRYVVTVLVVCVCAKLYASQKGSIPTTLGSNEPKTTKVTFAHVSLMHPYFEEPAYAMGAYSGKLLDLGEFEDEIKAGWVPDRKYQVLVNMISTLFRNRVDIISIAGVVSQEMGKNLVYALYSAALKNYTPVAGFDNKVECNICAQISYNEEAQSLFYSLYPIKSKVVHCENFYSPKLRKSRALGCFQGGRIDLGITPFTYLYINMAELPVILEAQSLMKDRKLKMSIPVGRKSVIEDYLAWLREQFRPGYCLDSLPYTSFNEHVIYSGFWGVAANSQFDAPMFNTSLDILNDSLAVQVSPIQKGLTSLNIMSDPQSLEYFLNHGILLPQSDSLVDFIGYSFMNRPPITSSMLTAFAPEEKDWPGHHIVMRTLELSRATVIKQCSLD